jgi:hypothetical protein
MAKKTEINWEGVSIKSTEFIHAEKEGLLPQLLFEYFSKAPKLNRAFLRELADTHPILLMNAIRLTQSFLKKSKSGALKFLSAHSNKYLRDHYKVFSRLSQEEEKLYDKFRQTLNPLSAWQTMEVLSYVALWFEAQRASLFDAQVTPEVKYDINPAIEVVNFFLSHYFKLPENSAATIHFEQHSNIVSVLRILNDEKLTANIHIHPIWRCLDEAAIYLYHLKGTFEIYSFDLNYEVAVDGNKAELKFLDEEKWRRWQVENLKMDKWYNYYGAFGEDKAFDALSIDKDGFVGSHDLELGKKFKSISKKETSKKVAEDYCLTNSYLGSVPTDVLIDFFTDFVNDAYCDYVFPMDIQYGQYPGIWTEKLYHFIGSSGLQNIDASPIIILNEDELLKRICEKYSVVETTARELVDCISTDPSQYKSAGRFNPFVNLGGKPLIKLENQLIGFRGVVGESVSQVNVLTNIMECNHASHQNVEKQEVEILEDSVKKMFEDAGFHNSDCKIDIYKAGKLFGNFDIVVYENGVILIIELKRSKSRIQLSDVYREHEYSLAKASIQLEKVSTYLSENFTDCKTKLFHKLKIKENVYSQVKVYPLIVSTSLENDHIFIRDRHFKISLFELQNILIECQKSEGRHTLHSLIDFIFGNKYWMNTEKYVYVPNINKWTLRFDV